jgi:hypothetical protein
MSDIIIDEFIVDVYEKIQKHIIKENIIDTPDLIKLIPTLIDLAESLKTLSGFEKKSVVVVVLSKIVTHFIKNEEHRENMIVFVNATVPLLVDVVVYAANGKMVFLKAKKNTKSVIKKLMSCQSCQT